MNEMLCKMKVDNKVKKIFVGKVNGIVNDLSLIHICHAGTVTITGPRGKLSIFFLYKHYRRLWRHFLADRFRKYEFVNESFYASS